MLKSSIASSIPLSSCIYNASGPRTGSMEALYKIAISESGAVLSKSATLNKQDGNPLPRFINKVNLGSEYCEGSINSEGLPNYGIDYYLNKEELNKISKMKPYIISLSGLSLEDNLIMLNKVFQTEGVSGVELNLACPNIPKKPIIAYDFEQMDHVLQKLTQLPNFGRIPLGIKLAPYFDSSHFDRAAQIISKYPIRFIVCINTIGNGLFIDSDNECESIAPRNGLGGLGGGFVKHTALANVRNFYVKLMELGRGDIDIIGVGGVHSGKDAFELILCGAKAIQVGTCHWTEGSNCFKRISSELELIMKQKGYKNIEDFRGKLKPFVKPSRPTIPPSTKSNELLQPKMNVHILYGLIIAILVGFIAYLMNK